MWHGLINLRRGTSKLVNAYSVRSSRSIFRTGLPDARPPVFPVFTPLTSYSEVSVEQR